MNYEALKAISLEDREKYFRECLGKEKCRVLDKFNLHLNDRFYWERHQEKYPIQEYFSHRFAVKSSALCMIFHINRLCYAKVKYFEAHWDEYIPCTYNCKKGFVESELFDMEFIKQKDTDIVIDLRELAKIHWLKEFQELSLYLETEQQTVLSNNIKKMKYFGIK